MKVTTVHYDQSFIHSINKYKKMTTERFTQQQLSKWRMREAMSVDKGKRHYWGDQRGDYGFFSSDDRDYRRNQKTLEIPINSQSYRLKKYEGASDLIQNGKKNEIHSKIRRHRRVHTTNEEHYPKQMAQKPSLSESRRNNLNPQSREGHTMQAQKAREQQHGKQSSQRKKKRGVLGISKEIGIHLPRLNHSSSEEKMQQKNRKLELELDNDKKIENLNSQDISLNQMLSIKSKEKQIQRDEENRDQMRGKYQPLSFSHFPSRLKSIQGQSQQNHESSPFYEQRRKSIKYSPTYICSEKNPLPTRKLYYGSTQQDGRREIVYDMIS